MKWEDGLLMFSGCLVHLVPASACMPLCTKAGAYMQCTRACAHCEASFIDLARPDTWPAPPFPLLWQAQTSSKIDISHACCPLVPRKTLHISLTSYTRVEERIVNSLGMGASTKFCRHGDTGIQGRAGGW